MSPSNTIQYTAPTSNAFDRMKGGLFRPFDIGKWFVLGFTAWLAGLLDGGGGGGGGGGSGDSPGNGGGMGRSLQEAGNWIQDNLLLVIGLGSIILILVAGIVIALLWVSSRGKFMFLDNLVHNRAEVKTPWKAFRTLGNSLFLWRLVFGLIVFVLFAFVGGLIALVAFNLKEAAWGAVILGAILLFPAGLAAAYISLLLEDFVIPVMYKNSVTCTEAWRAFLKVHNASMGYFILFALWKILLWIATLICIAAVGFGTCCVGFVLMMIPYLGAVVLLPVSTFFRFLGPEFLGQFGDEFDILKPTEELPPQLS